MAKVEINALRLSAQKKRLLDEEYDHIKTIITECFIEHNPTLEMVKGEHILKLFLATFVIGQDKPLALTKECVLETINKLAVIDITLLTKLSEAINLDDEANTKSLTPRFEQLPELFEALNKNATNIQPFLELSNDNVLMLVNASGRALNCFNSEVGKSQEPAVERLATLLKGDLEKDDVHRALLDAFPWLFERPIPDETKTYINLLDDIDIPVIYRQLYKLAEQFDSIDYSKSNHLPSTQELTDLLNSMRQPDANISELRRTFVSYQIEQGCWILMRDTAYRPLNEDEIQQAELFVDKHLHPWFKQQNKPLFSQFIQQAIAVKADAPAGTQIDNILRLLVRLDNKAYHNDLGQVLGILLKASKPNNRYSSAQLSAWLELINSKDKSGGMHFPTGVLETLLNVETKKNDSVTRSKHSTLINADLDVLSNHASNHNQRRQITNIMKSNIHSTYKPVLVNVALQGSDYNHYRYQGFVDEAITAFTILTDEEASSRWLKELRGFVTTCAEDETSMSFNTKRLKALSIPTSEVLTKAFANVQSIDDVTRERLDKMWSKTQTTFICLYQMAENDDQKQKLDSVSKFHLTYYKATHSNYYARMVIASSIEGARSFPNTFMLNQVDDKCLHMPINELKQLAIYMATEPKPSLEYLNQHLSKRTNVNYLIDQFERVHQATDKNGDSKRLYSLTPEDRKSLLRVTAGMKFKGKAYLEDTEQKQLVNLLYYANNYSLLRELDKMPSDALQKELLSNVHELKALHSHSEDASPFIKAKILACMREIIVRQTGKWPHHTQMMDLLISALHNDESLLHQVKTGEGKSIISIMRAAYLALNGYTVDVFSAKESLSRRDHEEFSHVLDAMGIPNAYITASSPKDHYKTGTNRAGIGSVNYATIGNFSLFQSKQVWSGERSVNLLPPGRVAFLDECDHILRDEDTQFNFTDSRGAEQIYNLNEWVYRCAFDYYESIKDELPKDEQDIRYIHRNSHLKALCEQIQLAAEHSPSGSDFFQKFILPALDPDNTEAKQARDNQLKRLLIAAHTANNLKEGIHYSIRPEQQRVASGVTLNTRFAKVVIANQIKHVSTYSDLVQQFLHVKLNKEATAKGEQPNFFVEPDSKIALSQNAKYLLKKHYEKLEGCTGTAGSKEDLHAYESIFVIERVIKLPTHETIKTNFLGATYCDSLDAQANALAEQIIKHKDRPILITHRDDISVKALSALVKEKLQARDTTRNVDDYVIVDTNDSGKSERDIVPLAGAAGRVTFSSRMGRGTDIKPNSEQGLFVIRTYPAIPRVTKQELGRQGRNGAAGQALDIIDYESVLQQYQKFERSPYQTRLEAIFKEQDTHYNATTF
jgi:hypothetical protein